MRYGSKRGNEREVTIGTAHTVTVDSLIDSNKQTKKPAIKLPRHRVGQAISCRRSWPPGVSRELSLTESDPYWLYRSRSANSCAHCEAIHILWRCSKCRFADYFALCMIRTAVGSHIVHRTKFEVDNGLNHTMAFGRETGTRQDRQHHSSEGLAHAKCGVIRLRARE
jgi:hypothetical protein